MAEIAKPPVENPPKRCKPDFSTTCPQCLVPMIPVHTHYQCTRCGWRDSCCF
jgi:transposase